MPDAISCGDRATRKIGDEPHYVNYVSRWRTNDGCQVRLDFAMRWNGGCWENVDDILLGWPLGATHRHHHHIYLRDPNQILGTRYAAAFDPDATLPENAMDTGLRQHETELWLIPNHDQFVWLVQGDSVERWPHVTQEFGCA